jgi:biotin operon repressor
MTALDIGHSAENTDLKFSSLGERCVYLYLRFYADRKGRVRVSLTDLAEQLDCSRRTINDHVKSLLEKRLLTHQGHGRYRAHATPWSLRDVGRAYLSTLDTGDEFDTSTLFTLAFGEDGDWGSADPRLTETLNYAETLERAKILAFNEMTGTYTRIARTYI